MFDYFKHIKSKLRKHLDLRKEIAYDLRSDRLKEFVLHSHERGITDTKYGGSEIIVSLTTYEPRLYDVYLAIESIMQQTWKANRIVLWLPDRIKETDIPQTLRNQADRGLEIRYCNDSGPHTKLLPSLRCFPEAAIITIDDDILYDIDLLERLIGEYLKAPQYIHYCRGHRIVLKNNRVQPYAQWKWCAGSEKPSALNFPTGVGGVLYPPHTFDDEVFNETVFRDICRHADDIWFKAMSLRNGKQSRKVTTHTRSGEDYLENKSVQECALERINRGEQNLNDVQFDAVFSRYALFDKLSDEMPGNELAASPRIKKK